MSSQNGRIIAGQLYSKADAAEALGCGNWYLEALSNWYGLIRLGTQTQAKYEGGDIIAAMRRHALDDVVEKSHRQPPSKDELLRRGREKKKKQTST